MYQSHFFNFKFIKCIIFPILLTSSHSAEVCYKDECVNNVPERYFFYDVNPSEGFNLRRDVYMRLAVLFNKLNKSDNPKLNTFKLVLPPWSHLPHWSYSEHPEYMPWGLFFDLDSLQKFAPVIEMNEFFSSLRKQKYNAVQIDEVYILQHYDDMFETGNFEDRWEVNKCQKPPKLRYFYYPNITSSSVKCLSFHGPATKLQELLKRSSSKTVMIDHAEIVLHHMFGSKTYWEARRSMRFSKELHKIANEFRKHYLNSTDEFDKTEMPLDWRDEKPKRNAVGGPYISVHLRRKDFVRSRANEVPTIGSTASQIRKILHRLNLTKVFVATDTHVAEFNELREKLSEFQLYKFVPSSEIQNKYKDGGIAIIEQIVCSYSRYFIGTSESTFTFRIQEEREILGFPEQTTFNVFCKNQEHCNKPSVWKINYR